MSCPPCEHSPTGRRAPRRRKPDFPRKPPEASAAIVASSPSYPYTPFCPFETAVSPPSYFYRNEEVSYSMLRRLFRWLGFRAVRSAVVGRGRPPLLDIGLGFALLRD